MVGARKVVLALEGPFLYPRDLLTLIKERRTIRVDFQPRRISKKDLRFLLEAARWAPSGHNLQPWEFIAVQEEQMKKKIAQSTMSVIEEILRDPEKLKKTFGSYFKWFYKDRRIAIAKGYGLYGTETPAYLREEITPDVIEELRRSGEKYCERLERSPLLLVTLLGRKRVPPNISSGLISLTSVGGALQNIRLAAAAKGIGCQDAARPIDTVEGRQRLKQILKVPAEYDIVSTMRLGYVNPKLRNIYYTRFRIALDDILHYDIFRRD